MFHELEEYKDALLASERQDEEIYKKSVAKEIEDIEKKSIISKALWHIND